MKTTLPPVQINDRKARLIGIPLVSLLISLAVHFDDMLLLNVDFFKALLVSFINTLLIWEGSRSIFKYARSYFPEYSQTRQRLVIQTLTSITYTLFVSIIVDYWLCSHFLHIGKPVELFKGFKIALIPTAIITLIYESVYFFESWRENVKRTEAFARENVQSQLEVLKNQLDPHFLFNSLNTLASLIDDTNEDAQKYLEQLSDVYRYVLVSREKNTVSLEEELAFLDAYVHLNKTRFRENLQVEKKISQAVYRQQIAPLSLQMLVENAIKHNIVSSEKPLRISISHDAENYLTVENNVQEKKIFEKSTKVGLENIRNRYLLLTDKPMEIIKNADFFRVKIPLLQN
ncbi:MAG: histidine kinase [Verrucomicrobia bacterium]|nr:histidine kinase [Cytophagales bacterium]